MIRVVLALLLALWSSAALAADAPAYGPPPEWVKDIKVPAPKADEGGAIQFLLRDTQIRSSEEGLETYARGAIEIRTIQGLNAIGTIAVPWSPHSDTLTIHHVRVLRDGRATDALAEGQKFTVLRREENLELSMLDGVLTASFQPQDLRVGDVLDFAFTLRRKDAAYRGKNEQFTTTMVDEYARKVRVRALWPKSRPVRWRLADGLPKPQVTSRDGETELLVEMDDVQPYKVPESSPPRFAEVGYLELTEFGSWKDISSLLAEPYEAAMVLAPGSPLKAEAARIRAASNDPKVQAATALRLVQDQVRYVFQGMDSGYLPDAADNTWARRFGDCKAKSVLLAALLRELGIEAGPALVSLSANDGLDSVLPLMQRFDHVIVRTVIGGKVYWLDGARVGDRDLDAQPAGLYRWALPIRAPGSDLERLPMPSLLRPLMATELHFDASNGLDAPAPARGSLILSGDLATLMKANYDNLAGAARQTYLRDYWKGSYDWIAPTKTGLSYDDDTGEVRLTFEGEADLKWYGSSGRLRRYAVDGSTLGWEAPDERDPGPHAGAPYAVNFPHYATVIETIVLPHKGQGFTIEGKDIDRVIGAWELKRHSVIKDGVFTMTASTRSTAPEIAYADMRANAKPLAELAEDVAFVIAPFSYEPTSAELKALDERQPGTAGEFVERGVVFLNRGDLDKALADLNEAVRLEPRSALALANRGVTLFWKDDFEKAEADFAAALEIDPAQSVAYNGRGLMADRRDDAEAAVAAYTRAIDLNPGSGFALLRRARVRLGQKQYEAALVDIDRALKTDPESTEAHDLRAQALAGQGKFDEALADADALMRISPDSSAHLARGNVLLRLHRRAEARAAYDASLALEPNAAAYVGRSQVYEPKDPAKSLADLDAALKLEPDLFEARMLKAQWLIREDKATEALALLDGLMNERPTHRGVASLREDALMRLGRYDEAIAALNAALGKAPADPNFLNRRCWVRMLSNTELDSGLADCEAALKAKPDNPAALDSRGWVQLRRGQLDRAIADFDAALKLAPDQSASLFGRGIARLRKGQKEQGEADLAAARKLNPQVDSRFSPYGLTP